MTDLILAIIAVAVVSGALIVGGLICAVLAYRDRRDAQRERPPSWGKPE